jgi:PAS domain S-box-containing protein
MKSLKYKLLLLIGISVIISSGILIHKSYTSVTSYVENLTSQQLSLALSFDLAIREYVAETIRPMMFKLVAKGEFIPEAMSSSYIARRIFEKVNKKFPDYIIKFASFNPRNPVNLAGPEELDMITYFNNNPDLTVWEGDIDISGKEYYATFSASRMEKSCLRCHGDPGDAPLQLIERYGSNASFNHPLGKVVGLDTIAIPSDTVKSFLLKENFKNLGFLLVVIALLCTSIVFIFKFVITDRLGKITNHFIDAEKQSEKLKLRRVEVKGSDEIAILAESFNKLSTKLNRTYIELTLEIERREQVQKALRENEEKYRKLFEMESDALALIDSETERMLDVNPAFIKLFGFSKEEILGMKITDFSKDPDETKKGMKNYDGYIPLRFQKKKNGALFSAEITSNFFDYMGRKVCMAAIRDISDRRTIEEQIQASLNTKELLLNEIHHRVKNNFEIISSLLDMSSMTSDNQEIQKILLSSRTRIHSMSMIHSQLYQSESFDRVNMVKHINELSENLKFLYNIEKKIDLTIEPSNVYLSLNQAIPCALILNELITNSIKYAFVGREHGTIRISILDSDDNTVFLRVKDDGIGISDEADGKPASGLGLLLVKNLVIGQLKGEININNDDGTNIFIEFKRL